MKRLAIIAAACLAMGAIGADLASRLLSPCHRAAVAILAGERTALADADALEAISNEAGYRWAERHAIDRPGACPAVTVEFREGCEEWVADSATRR
jgi:hypothetical protein